MRFLNGIDFQVKVGRCHVSSERCSLSSREKVEKFHKGTDLTPAHVETSVEVATETPISHVQGCVRALDNTGRVFVVPSLELVEDFD